MKALWTLERTAGRFAARCIVGQQSGTRTVPLVLSSTPAPHIVPSLPPRSGSFHTSSIAAASADHPMQPIKLHGGASQPGDYATPYNNGLEAFARGDFADAERWFRRALRVEPNSADCLYNLGNAQMAAGLIDAAVESYTKSLGLKPNQPDVLVNLGNAYALSKKDPASAILNFEAALRIAEDPQARFNLAVVLDNEGRLEEAVDNYRKALKGGIGHAEKFLRNAMVRLASRVAQSGSKEGADKKE